MLTDEKLQQVTGQIVVGQAVLVAYELGLFKALLSGPLAIQEIGKKLNLKERAIQGMISCACSMELIECVEGLYQLTLLGYSFFDEESPTYYGNVFDLLISQSEIMTFSAIRDAILFNSSQADAGRDIFSGNNDLGSTQAFVKAIHQKAVGPAFHWVKLLNLSKSDQFIDIAGGSGIHTIAACMENHVLKGMVCDRKSVLSYASDYIRDFGLQDRIETKELDIWNDLFPHGDVFFLADIFHDWNRNKCLILAKKCYEAMSTNGRIVLHEMLFNDDKTGPVLSSAYNMKMLLWTEGQQYSFREIRDILQEAGFKNILRIKALGNWSLIVGDKS